MLTTTRTTSGSILHTVVLAGLGALLMTVTFAAPAHADDLWVCRTDPTGATSLVAVTAGEWQAAADGLTPGDAPAGQVHDGTFTCAPLFESTRSAGGPAQFCSDGRTVTIDTTVTRSASGYLTQQDADAAAQASADSAAASLLITQTEGMVAGACTVETADPGAPPVQGTADFTVPLCVNGGLVDTTVGTRTTDPMRATQAEADAAAAELWTEDAKGEALAIYLAAHPEASAPQGGTCSGPVTVSEPEPATVAVPALATIPTAMAAAGDGSTVPKEPLTLIVLIVAAAIGATAAVWRLTRHR